MLQRKMFWYGGQAVCLAVWIFNIIGLIKPYGNEATRKLWKISMPVWAIIHPVEIPLAYGLAAKGAGVSLKRTVVKTILYGFTWWVPLKMGVLEK